MTKSMAAEQKKEKKRIMYPVAVVTKDLLGESNHGVGERAKHEFHDLALA